MRRILLFLLVFGAGSAVLWHFESKRRADEAARTGQQAPPPKPPNTGAGERPTDPAGPVEGAPVEGPDGPADGAAETDDPLEFAKVSDYLSVVWPGDEERPDLTLDIDYLQPEDPRGTHYLARGIVIVARERLPDGTSAVLDTVTAKSGRFAFEFEGPRPSGLSSNEPMTMEDVVVVRERNAAVVPLTLSAPRLRAFHDIGRYESIDDDVVQVDGPGLTGSGRELVFEGELGQLTLGRGARVKFTLEDGRLVDFWTTGDGPLVLSRVAGDDDAFEAKAIGGARLELLGEPPATVDAESITVTLRKAPEGGFKVDFARADGAVVVTQGTDRYIGDSARVLSPDGELSRVTLSQSPEARVTVRGDQGEDVDVIVRGLGPLVVDVERAADDLRRAKFVFQGPGDVRVPARDLVIAFEDFAEGKVREDEGRASFVAAGGVVATRADVQIDTASLTATVVGDSQDERVHGLVAVTEGPTIMRGKSEAGDDLRVDAVGGLAARLVEGEGGVNRWLLERASDVTIERLGGLDPMRAEAGLVLEGDLLTQSFRLEDGVRFASLLGEASATHGLLRGRERVELTGDAEQPARIVLAPDPRLFDDSSAPRPLVPLGAARAGELNARSIELTETTLDARGEANGYLETLEGRLELDAEHVRLTRVLPVADPTAPVPVTLVADGVRRAELIGAASLLHVAARRIEADALVEPRETPGEDGDTDRLRITELGANGAVALSMKTVDGSLEIDADDVHLTRGTAAGPETFEVTSHRVVQATLEQPGRTVRASCLDLAVSGRFEHDAIVPEGSTLVASGEVWVEMTGNAALEGRCDRLVLRDGRRASLEPAPGQRVAAHGFLPTRGANAVPVPYQLFSGRLVYEPDLLDAIAPELRLDQADAALELASGIVLTRASAGRMIARPDELRFDGGFEAEGRDRAGTPVTLKAGSIVAHPTKPLRLPGGVGPHVIDPAAADEARGGVPLEAAARQEPQAAAPQRATLPLQDFDASGGFGMEYGAMRVTAERASASGNQLRLTGWPDQPAVLEYAGQSIEATWITFDADEYLVSAGRGILRSAPGEGEFSLAFASIEPRVQGDESMVIIASPLLVRGRDQMRADWVSLWLLRDAWRAKGAAALYNEGQPPPPPPPAFTERDIPGPDLLASALLSLQQKEFASYIRALYAEGDIEVTQGGARSSRADALYLDVGEASGWLSEAELVQRVEAGSRSELIRIRAGRLETDGSGRLIARRATLTTCDHDLPHYVVLTQELALEPRADGRWRFGARGNRLRFANGLQVPLPSIGNAVLDESGDFEGFENDQGEVTPLNSLTLAQTARFGASIGASFGFETGRVGRWLASLLGMNTDFLRGRWDTEAKWLGNRGPLVSAKLDLRERNPRDEIGEDFRMEFYLAGIPDRGDDHGILRVDESDRSEERVFGWMRGRYPIVRGEWVDLAFSGQTDAGVQAEFFEQEFMRWDQRDTYVRWRKSRNGAYFSLGASKRIDSFRTEVEELPSVGAYLGQREIAALGRASLLYGGSVDVAHLRRREGGLDRDPFSEVPGGAALGLDGRETVRGNLNQRLDLAVPTGVWGARAVPFLELGATGWTENQFDDGNASRFALLGGAELATALHSSAGGFTNVLAPRIGARTDLAYETSGLAPTPFDSVERAIDGTVYEAGVRGLWTRPGTFENLDIDVRVQRTEDRMGFADTTELGLLGEWITRVGSGGESRFGLLHDGRYDVDDGETNFSRSTVAWSPREEFLIEGRYARARGADNSGLYEAAGIDARWMLDPKWEIEVHHTWSLTGEGTLDTGLRLRRFAHDFLLEFDVSKRAGEGGTSFGISFNPLLAWSRPRLGLLDRR